MTSEEIEKQLPSLKNLAEGLKRQISIFSNTFKNLVPKERFSQIRKIQEDSRLLEQFLSTTKGIQGLSTAAKFSLENLRQSQTVILTLWKKTEKAMESHSVAGSRAPQTPSDSQKATEDYSQLLQKLGHAPTQDQLQEFQDRLSDAYKKAQEKSGQTSLSIEVVEVDGKIKVRFNPRPG